MPLEPKNITARLAQRKVRGNPPSTQPESAISNCFPGLEFDFRNIWKLIFVGVELHEAGLTGGHIVMDVTSGSPAELAGVPLFSRLLEVAGRPLAATRTLAAGPTQQLQPLSLSDALAHILTRGGEMVDCIFVGQGPQIRVQLEVREVFKDGTLSEDLAEPGALTQGLCSPWQADYRECGCYYWAASRPDFVNAEVNSGNTEGHDWMQKNRTDTDTYERDRGGRAGGVHITYSDLYNDWESQLTFIKNGKDSE